MPHPLSSFLALGVTIALVQAQQGGPPPQVQWLMASDLEPRLQKRVPWLSLINRSALAVGRYRLAAGSKDLSDK